MTLFVSRELSYITGGLQYPAVFRILRSLTQISGEFFFKILRTYLQSIRVYEYIRLILRCLQKCLGRFKASFICQSFTEPDGRGVLPGKKSGGLLPHRKTHLFRLSEKASEHRVYKARGAFQPEVSRQRHRVIYNCSRGHLIEEQKLVEGRFENGSDGIVQRVCASFRISFYMPVADIQVLERSEKYLRKERSVVWSKRVFRNILLYLALGKSVFVKAAVQSRNSRDPRVRREILFHSSMSPTEKLLWPLRKSA